MGHSYDTISHRFLHKVTSHTQAQRFLFIIKNSQSLFSIVSSPLTTPLCTIGTMITISTCEVQGAKAVVQVSKSKLHRYLHLDQARLESLSCINEKKKKGPLTSQVYIIVFDKLRFDAITHLFSHKKFYHAHFLTLTF